MRFYWGKLSFRLWVVHNEFVFIFSITVATSNTETILTTFVFLLNPMPTTFFVYYVVCSYLWVPNLCNGRSLVGGVTLSVYVNYTIHGHFLFLKSESLCYLYANSSSVLSLTHLCSCPKPRKQTWKLMVLQEARVWSTDTDMSHETVMRQWLIWSCPKCYHIGEDLSRSIKRYQVNISRTREKPLGISTWMVSVLLLHR